MAADAAKAVDEGDPEAVEAEVAPVKKGKGLVIGVVLLLLLIACGAGGYLFMGKKPAGHEAAADEHGAEAGHGDAAKSGSANYLPLDPAFVVNLNDTEAARFLQVQVEVMARDAKVLDAVKLHMPRIRNSLLLLFGQQRYQDISTREGKEALQKKVLEEVQKVMKDETGANGVEAVYFTSFVMQ
jgi:flagellar FliL protein